MSSGGQALVVPGRMKGRRDHNVLLGVKLGRHGVGEDAFLVDNQDGDGHGWEPRSLRPRPKPHLAGETPTSNKGLAAPAPPVSGCYADGRAVQSSSASAT